MLDVQKLITKLYYFKRLG